MACAKLLFLKKCIKIYTYASKYIKISKTFLHFHKITSKMKVYLNQTFCIEAEFSKRCASRCG